MSMLLRYKAKERGLEVRTDGAAELAEVLKVLPGQPKPTREEVLLVAEHSGQLGHRYARHHMAN